MGPSAAKNAADMAAVPLVLMASMVLVFIYTPVKVTKGASALVSQSRGLFLVAVSILSDLL